MPIALLELLGNWALKKTLDATWDTAQEKLGTVYRSFIQPKRPDGMRIQHERLELAYDLFFHSSVRTEFMPPTEWGNQPPDVELGGTKTYEHEAEVIRSITNTLYYSQRPEVWNVKDEPWLSHTDCSQVMLASGSSNPATRLILGTPDRPIFSPRVGDFTFKLKYSIAFATGTLRRWQYNNEIERPIMALVNEHGKKLFQPEIKAQRQVDDYLLVTRVPGPTPDSVLTVLAGLHAPGTRSSELLLNGIAPSELQKLASCVDHRPGPVSYYQAVFRASGLEKRAGSDVASRLELVTEGCPPWRIEANRITAP
jgi:hypothetical protein